MVGGPRTATETQIMSTTDGIVHEARPEIWARIVERDGNESVQEKATEYQRGRAVDTDTLYRSWGWRADFGSQAGQAEVSLYHRCRLRGTGSCRRYRPDGKVKTVSQKPVSSRLRLPSRSAPDHRSQTPTCSRTPGGVIATTMTPRQTMRTRPSSSRPAK